MIVTIDGTDWLYGERAVRRHVVNLVKGVGSHGEDIDYRIFVNQFRATPYPEPLESRPRVEVRRLRCPRRVFDILNQQFRIPATLFTGRSDLFHATGSNIFVANAKHYVYTVPGLGVFVRPDIMDPDYVRQRQDQFRSALARITHFLTVSQKTREELIERFEIPEARISTVPLGVEAFFQPMAKSDAAATLKAHLGPRMPPSAPTILYVGGIQRNKNITGLIEAFDAIAESGTEDVQLMLVGPKVGVDAEIDNALAQATHRNRIHWVGALSGEALRSAYCFADLFVFPTFYEGWTSPPLEAMACGTPVVTSNVSSVPETVGDAAELVDPGDPEDIARGIDAVLNNDLHRNSLVEKGHTRAAHYSWERCVGDTVAVYNKLLNS